MSTETVRHENRASGMTNQTGTDPTRTGELAQQIVALLIDKDSVTRHRAIQAALMLLGEVAPTYTSIDAEPSGPNESSDHVNLATFFNRGEEMKPADYAQLCAAYHYSIYGTVAFSLVELKAIATEAGVVIPDRVDKWIRYATNNNKKLFQSVRTGAFKPTAAAGLLFWDKWKIKPGKKAKPTHGKNAP